MSEAKPCTVDVNEGRMKLKSRAGMTLFAALRTNGVLLPTGCGARGECGQCKVTLLSGRAGLMTDNEVKLIPEDERAAGKRLGCQLRLEDDIAVRVPEYVFDAKERNATLTEVIPLTHDIKRFSFSLEDGDTVPHRAGQFMTLIAKVPDHPGQVMRCFSFATSSRVVDRVDIIVRRTPKGVMTPFLFEQAKPGDRFRMIAPYGDFYLREGGAPCIWIGGGSGLSPFMGMLQDLMDREERRPVHLFFGAVYPKDLYYVDLLNDIAKHNDWFTFTPALSGDERCDFCHDYGLITEVVDRHVADARNAEGYLCGGPGMIGACIKLLTEKGMPRDKIFYDRF
jgi:Na+-transporting NADH:ubiquinone oxidoreductase, subunit NqrF